MVANVPPIHCTTLQLNMVQLQNICRSHFYFHSRVLISSDWPSNGIKSDPFLLVDCKRCLLGEEMLTKEAEHVCACVHAFLCVSGIG